jgi:hypothetical protein
VVVLLKMCKGQFKIPVIRRSRESGNPEKSRRWIPAYAGMTTAQSVSARQLDSRLRGNDWFSSFPKVLRWLMKRESGFDIALPPLKKGE